MSSKKNARINRANKNTPAVKQKLPVEVVIATRMVGVFARVAREQGKSPSHVIRVARGERPSTQILKAIVREVSQILKEETAA
jgi:hypothetical protein